MSTRIATYNLFEGATTSYNRLIEFVREANLDVLCLQEVNRWEDNDLARLKDFTDKVLFTSYAFGNSNTQYKLATVAKHPILKKVLHAEAFWHAALETHLKIEDKEITVFNAHLDPWQEGSRNREIARLIAAVNPHVPTIITGDFNSLSREDKYPPDFLDQLQKKGIGKYGTQYLEFAVIDQLLGAGFIDISTLKNNHEPTVPSAFSTDESHEVPARIDYMFVSPDLAEFVIAVERLKTDLTDTISDHYPLIATFEFSKHVVMERLLPPVPGAPRPLPPEPMPSREIPEPWTPPEDIPQEIVPEKKSEPEVDEDGDIVIWSHDKK